MIGTKDRHWTIHTYSDISKEWEDVTSPSDTDLETVLTSLLNFVHQGFDVRIAWERDELSTDHQQQLFSN